jgi:hypothetical protein
MSSLSHPKDLLTFKLSTLPTRRSFTASQRLLTFGQYASAPVKTAVLDHHVNRSIITKWNKVKPKLDTCLKKKTTLVGRRPTSVTAETCFVHTEQGLLVTRNCVTTLMRHETLVSHSKFKASA